MEGGEGRSGGDPVGDVVEVSGGMGAAGADRVDPAVRAVIATAGGSRLDLLDPRAGVVRIEDVAHGLAFACRYAGQCERFFSLAEHALLVADACAEAPLAALMLHAAKAFVGDLPEPMRALLPAYRRIERNVTEAIFELVGLPTAIPSCVEDADRSIDAAVRTRIAAPDVAGRAREDVGLAAIQLRHVPPFAVEREFLQRFEALYESLHRIPGRPPR